MIKELDSITKMSGESAKSLDEAALHIGHLVPEITERLLQIPRRGTNHEVNASLPDGRQFHIRLINVNDMQSFEELTKNMNRNDGLRILVDQGPSTPSLSLRWNVPEAKLERYTEEVSEGQLVQVLALPRSSGDVWGFQTTQDDELVYLDRDDRILQAVYVQAETMMELADELLQK